MEQFQTKSDVVATPTVREVVERLCLFDGSLERVVVRVRVPTEAKRMQIGEEQPFLRTQPFTVGRDADGKPIYVNTYLKGPRACSSVGKTVSAHPLIVEKVMSDGSRYTYIDYEMTKGPQESRHHLVVGSKSHTDEWWKAHHNGVWRRIRLAQPLGAYIVIAHGATARI